VKDIEKTMKKLEESTNEVQRLLNSCIESCDRILASMDEWKKTPMERDQAWERWEGGSR